MIRVTIYRDQDGVTHGFRVSGHAGFSKKGSDIVCSAVSLLVTNTINSIESLTPEKKEVLTDENNAVIDCRFPERKHGIINDKADLLINSMFLGLKEVERQYGRFIKITEEAPK